MFIRKSTSCCPVLLQCFFVNLLFFGSLAAQFNDFSGIPSNAGSTVYCLNGFDEGGADAQPWVCNLDPEICEKMYTARSTAHNSVNTGANCAVLFNPNGESYIKTGNDSSGLLVDTGNSEDTTLALKATGLGPNFSTLPPFLEDAAELLGDDPEETLAVAEDNDLEEDEEESLYY